MRIRKEISPWSGKMFIRLALILFVLLNAVIILLNLSTGKSSFESYNWVLGLMQPVLLASVFTYHSRKTSLFVNDYQNIDAFGDKLNKNILSQGTTAEQSNETSSHYTATGWFYKLFNHWGGVETVFVQWGDEIVITGSSRIVSQVQDSLTWNTAFK